MPDVTQQCQTRKTNDRKLEDGGEKREAKKERNAHVNVNSSPGKKTKLPIYDFDHTVERSMPDLMSLTRAAAADAADGGKTMGSTVASMHQQPARGDTENVMIVCLSVVMRSPVPVSLLATVHSLSMQTFS